MGRTALPSPRKNTRRTVLIIDDDDDLRCLVYDALSSQGYTCREARDGSHAMALLDGALPAPDLVLLDIDLPVIGGGTLLRKIRADRRLAEVPVVLMTAAAIDPSRAAGCDGVLCKPFTLERLFRTVADVVRVRAAHAEAAHG
jgi:CheY-like chemotaxis protein